MEAVLLLINSGKSDHRNIQEQLATAVLELFKGYCKDPSQTHANRRAVLDLLLQPSYQIFRNSKEEEEFRTILGEQQVYSILSSNWGAEVLSKPMDTLEEKQQLFSHLLEKSESGPQLKSLASLLELWTQSLEVAEIGQTHPLNSQWFKLFEALVEHSEFETLLDLKKGNAAKVLTLEVSLELLG